MMAREMNAAIQELLVSLDYSGDGNGRPNTLCAEAAIAIRKLLDGRDRGWLIETARNEYWDGRQIGDDAVFICDAHEACRFARFEDAEAVRCWLLEKTQRPQRLRSAEHVFIANANQTGGDRE